MKYFGTPYPRDQGDRQELLPVGHGRRKEWDPFWKLDERFFEWAGNWEDAANAYADQVAGEGNG